MIWISSNLKTENCDESDLNVQPNSSTCQSSHSLLKFLVAFWQFSHYYGDYVSKPLDKR